MFQLASVYKPGITRDISGFFIFEKLDGVRAIWDGKRLVTRGGSILRPPWLDSLPRDRVIDGELFIGKGTLQEVSRIVRTDPTRESGRTWNDVKFFAFDSLDHPERSFCDRYRHLEDVVADTSLLDRSPLRILKPITQLSQLENEKSHDALVESALRQILDAGGEGLILRCPKSAFISGRSSTILKVKESLDSDAVVIGHSRGAGREWGRVGALLVREIIQDSLNPLLGNKPFKIGSGLSSVDRVSPPPIGSIVSFSYLQRTTDGIPRHATFQRKREDAQFHYSGNQMRMCRGSSE